jgi:hypothetical protein
MDTFTVGADFATTASEGLQAVDFDPWRAGYRTGASVRTGVSFLLARFPLPGFENENS